MRLLQQLINRADYSLMGYLEQIGNGGIASPVAAN
jgi:hypothetical protein